MKNKELIYEINKFDMLDMYEKGFEDALEKKQNESLQYYFKKLA